MTTVINNPGGGDSSGSSVGLILGGIALVVLGALFFMYALPMMRNNDNGVKAGVTLPVSGGNDSGSNGN